MHHDHPKDARKEIKMKNEKETETIKFVYDEYELCSEQNKKDHNCDYLCYEIWKDNCAHEFKEAEINKGIVYGYETISDLVLDTTDTDTITFITNFTKWVELESVNNSRNSQWHQTTLEYKNGEFHDVTPYFNKDTKKLLALTEKECRIASDIFSFSFWDECAIDERIEYLKEINFTEPFAVFWALNLLHSGAPDDFIDTDVIERTLLEQIQIAAKGGE